MTRVLTNSSEALYLNSTKNREILFLNNGIFLKDFASCLEQDTMIRAIRNNLYLPNQKTDD